MSIFDDREQLLKCLTDDLINAIEDDFFIPQMLKHRKSADFVQERIAELFIDLYETQVAEYDQHIQQLISQTSEEIASLQEQFNSANGEAKTRQNLESLAFAQRQQNVSKLAVKKTDLEYRVKKSMKITNAQLQNVDDELTRTKQTCSAVTGIIHSLDMMLQTGRSYINEFRKAEQLTIRKMRHSILNELQDCFTTHHEQSLKSEIHHLQRHNRDLQKALISVIRGFGQDNPDVDPTFMVESAVSAVRKESDIATVAEELHISDSESFQQGLQDLIHAAN